MEGSSSQSDDGSQSLAESDGSNPPHKKQKSYDSENGSPLKSVKKKRLRPYMKSASANELSNLVNDMNSDCFDLKENLSDGYHLMNANLENVTESVRKSTLYQNCEIDEKTCLKPSEAMRLFQEMDAAVNRGRAKKRKWLTSGKNRNNWSKGHSDRAKSKSTGELWALSHSLSLPAEESKQCDCFEYCECFGHRKSLTRSKSLSCLNVSDLRSFSVADSLPKTKSGGNLFQSEYQSVSSSSVSRRTSAQPSCKFQKDCLHLGYCDGLLQAKSTSANQICDCDKQTMYRTSRRQSAGLDGVSPETFVDQKQNIKTWFSGFNHEQKNLILKEILELCNMPQIHLLSMKMEPRLHHGCPPNCEDIITWLPNHLSLYIFSFLDPVSLCRCQSVCRAWKQLASEPCLWRRFCCQTMWQLSGSLQQKQMLNNMLPGGRILWKQVFAERFKLRNNWLKGRCNVRTFEGHTQGISCVQFDDTRIVSGSSDKTIKVWNIRTNTPLSVQTLVGHSGTVRCLHLEGNRLVSGSSDRTIKVWDLSTQQSWSSIACKVTMIGHLHTVRCLQVDDDKVISGSYDKTLKIWNIKTGHCRRTLRGHEGEVLCVQYDETKIVSGSVDKTIKIWSFDGECLRTLTGHQDAVTCLQFNMTRIVSGSLDCSLKFWDVDSCECLKTIDWKASEGHTRVVRCLQTDTWRVVSASDDRTLKVWSLETGKRLVTLRNHTDGVTCLQFNDSIIVSGSYDKTVKLWDFSCC